MDIIKFTNEYVSLSKDLYRVAFYILESQTEAEDAVQDILMKLWTMRNRLENVDSPRAFALVLTKNHCLDIVRRKNSHPRVPVREDFAVTEGPDLDTRDKIRKVKKEIEELPDKQRMVLTQSVILGKKYDRISKETGLSEGNLRVLLSTARKRLKERIK